MTSRMRTCSAARSSGPGSPVSPASSSGSSSNKSQIVLSKDQAVEIYRLRQPSNDLPTKLSEIAGKSALVAEVYEVSPKTIRDIWNRKTWSQATRDLWTEQETSIHAFEHVKMMLPTFMPGYAPSTQMMLPAQKPRGRPPGSKDSRPRKRKQNKGSDDEEDDGEPRMPNGATISDIREEIAALSKRKRMASAHEDHLPAQRHLDMGEHPAHKRHRHDDVVPAIEVEAAAPGPADFNRTQSPQAAGHAFQDGEHQHQQVACQDTMDQYQVEPRETRTAHVGGWMVPSVDVISGPQVDDEVVKPVLKASRAVPQTAFDYSYDYSQEQGEDPFTLEFGFDDFLSGMNQEYTQNPRSRMTLEMALSNSPEARVITEASDPHRIIHTNEAWNMLCGFSGNEVHGATLSCIQGPATDREVVADLMQRVAQFEEHKAVLVNYKKDGTPFLNMLNVCPIVDSQGAVSHYLGTLEDITFKDCQHPMSHFVCRLRANYGYSLTA